MSATLWICRDLNEQDPLLAARDALHQEIVSREARRLHLHVWAEREDEYLDYGIRGDHLVLLSLLQLLQEWGITGLTVDVFTAKAWRAFNTANLDFDFVDIVEEDADVDFVDILEEYADFDHPAILADARSNGMTGQHRSITD